MKPQRDWEKPIRRLELLLRLKSFPVGMKLLEKKEELDTIPFLRRMDHKVTFCQMTNLVRNFDWTVGATREDFIYVSCPSILGFTDIPPLYKDGTFRSIVWVRTREDGKRYEAAVPRIPLGKFEAVALAPQVYNPFEPDMILIYANPAQMMLLINALQFDDYEVMTFHCIGESSCADAIGRCYLTGKPSLTIPCYGERRYGHAQDDELVMALPPASLEKAHRNLETLYRKGIRYPISYAGAELDVTSGFPGAYGSLDQILEIRGDDNRLLLGVTGGIGSGKSTVATMLEELGAPIIDFDVLAREVVEPGKPAYDEIVNFFGRQVLQADGQLDRKALSKIVFRDFEKRKRLESFTHPRIFEAYHLEVERLAREHPGAVIQVDIPLLIELNLQHRFHKLLVVYVPEAVQVERLAARDGISLEEAANILKSQLPIDEKVAYADYVIRNDTSIEETRRQVEDLWKTLQTLQAERLASRGGC